MRLMQCTRVACFHAFHSEYVFSVFFWKTCIHTVLLHGDSRKHASAERVHEILLHISQLQGSNLNDIMGRYDAINTRRENDVIGAPKEWNTIFERSGKINEYSQVAVVTHTRFNSPTTRQRCNKVDVIAVITKAAGEKPSLFDTPSMILVCAMNTFPGQVFVCEPHAFHGVFGFNGVHWMPLHSSYLSALNLIPLLAIPIHNDTQHLECAIETSQPVSSKHLLDRTPSCWINTDSELLRFMSQYFRQCPGNSSPVDGRLRMRWWAYGSYRTASGFASSVVRCGHTLGPGTTIPTSMELPPVATICSGHTLRPGATTPTSIGVAADTSVKLMVLHLWIHTYYSIATKVCTYTEAEMPGTCLIHARPDGIQDFFCGYTVSMAPYFHEIRQ